MKPAFADAGFWIALTNPRDSLHRSATAAAASLRGRRIITTQMVLAEFLNDMAGRGPRLRSVARQAADRILPNSDTIVIPQTDAQFRSALALYAERGDKGWSLTDCASYLVMHAFGINEALTYDKDFEQMGFKALLRSEPTGS